MFAIPAVAAAASIAQGVSGFMASQYQAKVAKNNATIMQQNSQQALEEGSYAESMQRIQSAKQVSAVRAGAAAHGVDVNTGTPLGVQAGTAASGELDALAVRYNAQMKSYGYQTRAMNYKAQATADLSQGWNALFQGIGQAGGSYLSSSASLALAGGG